MGDLQCELAVIIGSFRKMLSTHLGYLHLCISD